MTKHTQYRVSLKGDPALVAVLKPFVRSNGMSLAEARELRRALRVIFGDKVGLDIASIKRIAPTARRL